MLFKKKHNYKDSSDEVLMAFVSKGKESAFNELYSRYSKKMLFFFYAKLYQNPDKANDFLQDLFLKIIETPGNFDTSKKFSTWIYTVAHNMCKNEYRKKHTLTVEFDKDLILAEEVSDYINKNDVLTFNELLQKELGRMEEMKCTTFILRYKQHFSIKEISEIMECSEGTVKSRVFYSLKILAEKLVMFNPKK